MKSYCSYRICPVGAHIDHQYGVVCGAAINLGTTFEYEILEEDLIIITSNEYKESISFKINHNINRNFDWADLFRGVINELKKTYILKKGIKGRFIGDLPSGGISSSSASQISFLKAIIKANNINLSKEEIIKLVYLVENNFLKLKVGILDPSMEILSKKDSLVFLDTLTNYYQAIENKYFAQEFEFVIIYSGIKRSLINSNYNNRIDELKLAYAHLDIDRKYTGKLRDIPDYYFHRHKTKLSNVEYKRAKHYFDETERVRCALQAWRKNDVKTFGRLMNESCESSIENYESGSIYLIDLYYITKSVKGVLGCRFLGAGFNGSSLAIINKKKKKEIINEISSKFCNKYPDLLDFKIISIELVEGSY